MTLVPQITSRRLDRSVVIVASTQRQLLRTTLDWLLRFLDWLSRTESVPDYLREDIGLPPRERPSWLVDELGVPCVYAPPTWGAPPVRIDPVNLAERRHRK
jgi:hypothetical protein